MINKMDKTAPSEKPMREPAIRHGNDVSIKAPVVVPPRVDKPVVGIDQRAAP